MFSNYSNNCLDKIWHNFAVKTRSIPIYSHIMAKSAGSLYIKAGRLRVQLSQCKNQKLILLKWFQFIRTRHCCQTKVIINRNVVTICHHKKTRFARSAWPTWDHAHPNTNINIQKLSPAFSLSSIRFVLIKVNK